MRVRLLEELGWKVIRLVHWNFPEDHSEDGGERLFAALAAIGLPVKVPNVCVP